MTVQAGPRLAPPKSSENTTRGPAVAESVGLGGAAEALDGTDADGLVDGLAESESLELADSLGEGPESLGVGESLGNAEEVGVVEALKLGESVAVGKTATGAGTISTAAKSHRSSMGPVSLRMTAVPATGVVELTYWVQ
ncbi:hypothetical protein [Mycobacterium sp.]|uniref:hypothetical protein n=1 Tax=Mycobacterium sp. TaxID=1785 RepID=UPI003BAEA3DB